MDNNDDKKDPVKGMFDAGEKEGSGEDTAPKTSEDGAEDHAEDHAGDYEENIEKNIFPKSPAEKMFAGGEEKSVETEIVSDKNEKDDKKIFDRESETGKSGTPGGLTAEEKLLKVIDSHGRFAEESKSSLFSSLFQGDFSGKIGDRFNKIKESLLGQRFSLATINKGLTVAIGLTIIASVVNVFAFKPDIRRVYSKVAKVNISSGGPAAVLRGNVEEYLKSIGKRSLFQMGTVESPGKNVPAVSESEADKVLGNLQLVGIAWGAYPEAMIRDKGDGRTHFLKKDQQFKGVKVEEILKDKVIVVYGDKKKELM